MPGISISDLQAAIKGRAGLARTNRFRIVISSPFGDGQSLNILCESCSLPGRQINTVDYSPWRNDNKIPIGYADEDVTCVFHLTNDYYVKEVFDKWLKKIVNPDSYLIEYVATYASTIDIYQLDEADQDIYAVKLLQAWPVSINSVELNNSDENNTQKLTVVFTYKTWTSEKLVASDTTIDKNIKQRKSEPQKNTQDTTNIKQRKSEPQKNTQDTTNIKQRTAEPQKNNTKSTNIKQRTAEPQKNNTKSTTVKQRTAEPQKNTRRNTFIGDINTNTQQQFLA